MDAIELLLTRQSSPRLVAPAPDESQLTTILNAAVRVPDHGGLNPWEFIVASGDGLDKLSQLFVKATAADGGDEATLAKVANMPRRAPMVVTVVAKVVEHPKVPEIEQHLAVGCACMAMQQASFALGLGGIWRTGSLAFNAQLHQDLGLGANDQIIGFLYLGTPAVKAPIKPTKPAENFVRYL
ncbi:NAD(P)H nitroreductase [Shewanella mesophila]|uniref:NAD(P)H nitroreductase n=1 Tax=Shewanella mesophila TaxID=2864208 RepID=UPI001C65ADCF|nr:NAD(P)H nitroreductase [Shewanella mesophila]QYJ87635.1 NAD(P)H nitroreductase [Shewanella mesophila]